MTCINMKAYADDISRNMMSFRVRAATQYVREIEIAARTAKVRKCGSHDDEGEEDDDDIDDTYLEPPVS